MKKVSLLLALFLGSYVCAYADYTQTLPLDYTDFFRAEALNADGEHLEVYTYANTDQKSSSKPDGEDLHGDQWNCSGKAADQKGENPVVAASTLEYGNYVDNKKGKEIILANLPLEDANPVTRASIYSLQKSYAYAGEAYYLAALVQINEATGKGDILTIDGNYTASAQRARLFVNKQGSGYKLGLGWNGDPDTWTAELAFGSTHLVVIKVTPKQAGNVTGDVEEASWWLDPDLSKTEGENDVFATVDGSGEIVTSGSTKGLKSVRGITIRQRSKISGKIAGLRFGDNWADVVKEAIVPSGDAINYVETDFKDGTWGEISGSAYQSGTFPSGTLNGFVFAAAGMQSGSKIYVYPEGNITYGNRISIDKNGYVELPLLKSVEKVVIYASSGSAEKKIILQKYNYASDKWVDVETYNFATTDCYRFETILNSEEKTRLRLVNSDGSTKFIWKIAAYPMLVLDRITTDFSNTEIWGTPIATTPFQYSTNEVEGYKLIKTVVQKGSVVGPAGESFLPRLNMDKKSNGGAIILPELTSINRIDIYASVGGEAHTFTLDTFDYHTDTWEAIETFECENTNTCYRLSKVLNRSNRTRLRIANADGSAKYIWKIVTYPTVPVDLEVPTNPKAVNIVTKSFTAQWEEVSNASGYRIVVFKENGDRQTTKEITGAGITQFNITGLAPATAYTYKVAAVGDGETTVDSELSEAVAVTTAAEITDSYTRPVTNGNYGTICLPKASENLSTAGAVFFEVAGKVMVNDQLSEIVFDEVTSLVAGKPYVFLANSDELNIPLVGDAVVAAVTSNGLKGSFTVKAISGGANKYVLSNNLLYCTNGREYYVGENRAYFDISSMSVFDPSAPKAPGRRRVSMKAEPQQTPTGIGAAETGSKPAKLLLNGSVVIIRNGVQYDITGQRIH